LDRICDSQLALPKDTCALAYATPGYETSVPNLAKNSLTGDMVFRDGSTEQVALVSGDVAGGLVCQYQVRQSFLVIYGPMGKTGNYYRSQKLGLGSRVVDDALFAPDADRRVHALLNHAAMAPLPLRISRSDAGTLRTRGKSRAHVVQASFTHLSDSISLLGDVAQPTVVGCAGSRVEPYCYWRAGRLRGDSRA
jgi:hypothetical protein